MEYLCNWVSFAQYSSSCHWVNSFYHWVNTTYIIANLLCIIWRLNERVFQNALTILRDLSTVDSWFCPSCVSRTFRHLLICHGAYSASSFTFNRLFCTVSQDCGTRRNGENLCWDRIISQFGCRSYFSSLVYSSITSDCYLDVLA